MKTYSIITLFIFFLFASFGLPAQEQPNTAQETQSIDEGSIDDQFDYVIRKSSNWRDERGQAYEVIRRNMLATLRAHAIDSINAVQARLDQTKRQVSEHQNEIAQLKTELGNTQGTLDATNKEKDSMNLLGMQMSKASYSGLLWTIIAVLAAGLVFFFLRFKNSNYVTRETKIALSDLEKEYKEHRRVALEREQKIKRELQDEINKHKA